MRLSGAFLLEEGLKMSLSGIFWKKYKERMLKERQKLKGPSGGGGNVVFILTSRCNFICKHCLRNLDSGSDLPFDVAQKVVCCAKKFGYSNICLTGGEPLLYPRLRELVGLITDNDFSFSVVSNGYLFNKHLDLFKEHRGKMRFIAFSLESTDKTKHDTQRMKGSFDVLMDNFRICREAKIPFRVVTAASLMNYDEIFDIALLAKKKGAQCLSMTTILPCPRSEENKLVLNRAQREELYASLGELSRMLKFPINISADIKACPGVLLCNAVTMADISVDMDGNLVQCCELSNYDDEHIRSSAVITSLKDKTFDQALKCLSERLHKFNCKRIEDYIKEPDPSSIDFNSCFYCLAPPDAGHAR
jgi:MoaA/NifB/PqqE/SkfB family radical SAM enzyme